MSKLMFSNVAAAPPPALAPPLPGESASERPRPTPSQVDQLAEASPNAISDTKDFVEDSFGWIYETASLSIDRFKAQLENRAEPPWFERLAEAALDVALLAGGAAAGELIAGKLLGELAKSAGHEHSDAAHEFVKGVFEEGLNTAVEAGRGHFRTGETVSSFIESQKQGLISMTRTRQTEWIFKGRHLLQSPAAAKAAREAFSHTNMTRAGERQYEATRDAWVGYLAQAKYGDISHEDSGGPATTNMMTAEAREKTNRWAPGFVPEAAPALGDAVFGRAPGVLMISAVLPELSESGRPVEDPVVTLALLNGVSEEVRREYEGQRIGDVHIPRHVAAKVNGDLPNFTINIDEAGQVTAPPYQQSAWLRARAQAAGPDGAKPGQGSQELIGTRLLLDSLVPNHIKGGM